MSNCLTKPFLFLCEDFLKRRLSLNVSDPRSQMAVIAKLLCRASATQVEVETLKIVGMFCGVGLTVSLLAASYGLDLSPGFF